MSFNRCLYPFFSSLHLIFGDLKCYPNKNLEKPKFKFPIHFIAKMSPSVDLSVVTFWQTNGLLMFHVNPIFF